MMTKLVGLILGGLLIGSVSWAVYHWVAFGEVQFGILPRVIGWVCIYAIAVGLGFVVRYSGDFLRRSRRRDDEVGK